MSTCFHKFSHFLNFMKGYNMKKIHLKSYAKINLTLDVLGILENGYHEVSMIMQQIGLCDDLDITWSKNRSPLKKDESRKVSIRLTTNRADLPTDSGNLAYRAAALMAEEHGGNRRGIITININKNIPVAAGLAGGSGNCAAVIHALNQLWDLQLSIKELCDLGSRLGSDVPFCIMGQAAANKTLKKAFRNDPLACHCALATGTGTDLQPLEGLRSHLILSKPAISVSTADVYKGIDAEPAESHPDNVAMIAALEQNNLAEIQKNMINVLENFTLKVYPVVMYTKHKMQSLCTSGCVLMSGSGPTVFGLCENSSEAISICHEMLADNSESFWTRTTW